MSSNTNEAERTSDQNKKKQFQVFREEDFEKVVEYTESDEAGSQNEDDQDEIQTLQICEEI